MYLLSKINLKLSIKIPFSYIRINPCEYPLSSYQRKGINGKVNMNSRNLNYPPRIISIFLILFVITSCKTQPKNSNINTLKKNGESFKLIESNNGKTLIIPKNISDNSTNYLLKICKFGTNLCEEDISSEGLFDISHLDQSTYEIKVYQCSNTEQECGNLVYKTNHKIESKSIKTSKMLSLLDKDEKVKLLHLHLKIKDHYSQIQQCTNQQPLTKELFQQHAAHIDQIEKLAKLEPTRFFSIFRSLLSTPYESIIHTHEQKSLNLVSNNDDVKITFINFVTKDTSVLGRDFEQFQKYPNWLKSFVNDHYGGHAALEIRVKGKDGKFRLYRYISWGGRDDITEKLEKYGDGRFKRISVDLPPVSREKLLEFEDWYRSSNYSVKPYNPLDILAKHRRSINFNIGSSS